MLRSFFAIYIILGEKILINMYIFAPSFKKIKIAKIFAKIVRRKCSQNHSIDSQDLLMKTVIHFRSAGNDAGDQRGQRVHVQQLLLLHLQRR
jgi:hypothetical protein